MSKQLGVLQYRTTTGAPLAREAIQFNAHVLAHKMAQSAKDTTYPFPKKDEDHDVSHVACT
jgi:hypothetical protein